MKRILEVIGDVFRYHKKKILFLFGSVILGVLMLFPYDDLTDFVTLQVTKLTASNVYLQFDGLSFGLMPQLGIKMENVVIESVFAPSLSVETLGFAPKITSLITGRPGGKIKAYGLFSGDGTVDFGPSNELDIDTQEVGIEVHLEKIQLKDLSKFLKDTYQFPVSMKGTTGFQSNLYIDPTFKAQPKGDIALTIDQLDIPSSNIPLNMNGARLSMSFPALKLSQVKVVGNINDRKLFIKEGKIGDVKNELHGDITGDLFIDILPGGRVAMGGYDLKINLTVGENLKRQLGAILGIVDSFENIGSKYKFDSLQGIRYSMRLTSPSMGAFPRVSGN